MVGVSVSTAFKSAKSKNKCFICNSQEHILSQIGKRIFGRVQIMLRERLLGLKASTVSQSIAHGENKESVNIGEASKVNLETHGGSSKASDLCHKTWVWVSFFLPINYTAFCASYIASPSLHSSYVKWEYTANVTA